MRLVWIVALLLLLHEGAQAQAADTVRLTFRWPDTTHARVEASRYRIRHTAQRQDTSGITVSYRMTAHRTGDEYIVSFDDYAVPGANTADSASRELASFMERLAAIVPSYRVNRGGEFVRLESPEALRAFMDSLFKSLTATTGPVPPQVQQLITNLSSDAVLSASAAQEWNAIVGTWIGGEVELGQAYESEGEEPIPVFAGTMMKFDYQFGALRRLSCDSVAAPNARDCVEMRFVSRPDSAAMRQFLSQFMNSVMPDSAASLVFSQLTLENVITLITRPETLLPVSMVMTKEFSGTLQVAGKQERLYQLDVRSQHYSYD